MKQLKNQIQLFSIIIVSFWLKDLIGNFSQRDKLFNTLEFNLYFVIEFKADERLDYEGLEQAIYEAVSSYGININQ